MSILRISLKEYLNNSINSETDKTKLCLGWDYLKANITEQLKAIIEKKEYWDLVYNRKMADFILNEIKEELTKEEKKQLDSFVYIMQDKKREQAKQDKENDILSRGYIKVLGTQKELDNEKVKGIFNISTIGLLGSFDKPTELEGTLKYSEQQHTLFLMPKRSRTKGYIIRDFAYIKAEG